MRVSRLVPAALAACLLAACAAQQPAAVPETGPTVEDIRAQADLAWKHGQHAAAADAYRRLLYAEPDNRDALLGLGGALLGVGESAQALQVYNKVLAQDPASPDAVEGQALAWLGLQRHDEAQAALLALEQRAPGRWRTRNALGLLADLRGDYAQARDWYRQALAVNAAEAAVWSNYGWSRLMARDYREGERLLQEALRRKPGAPRINANLAVAIAWQGDYPRALQVAMRTAPEHAAYNDVGYIALLRGDNATAARYFQAAIDKSPAWFARAAANLERAKRAPVQPR